MPDPFLDATAQADLVRTGEVSPIELVDAAIQRAEQLDPDLNAIVIPQFERARKEAASGALPDGVFRGVPFLLKDLGAHLAGDPRHSGMSFLKKHGVTERAETVFAGRLRAAGLVTLGRTNTPELGLLPTTEPDAYGASHNPWKLSHSPGGSSGGSAAAVAAGIVPAAHASDGGGSIRIPANHCGLVGLKPSRGRNSFAPEVGERWGGFSAEGFVTHSVRDTARLLDVVAGPAPGDPYGVALPARPYRDEVRADPGLLRIGLMQTAPRDGALHPECHQAVSDAAHRLEALGHGVEIGHPDALDDPGAVQGFLTVVTASTAAALDAASARVGEPIGPDDVEPLTWAVAELGRQHSAPAYVEAVTLNHATSRRLAAWWESGFDLLLTPTCAEPPPPLGEFAPAEGNPLAGFLRAVPFSTFTSMFNVSGQPAISLPLHESADGLPVGVQLVAAVGREDLLIRVAAQLEAAHPWSERRPPLLRGRG